MQDPLESYILNNIEKDICTTTTCTCSSTCVHVCGTWYRGTHQYLVKTGDLDGSSDRTKQRNFTPLSIG